MRSEAKTKPRKRGFVFESQNDSKVMSRTGYRRPNHHPNLE